MNSTKNTLAITQRRALYRLAWPAILEMVLHMSVWTLDTVMVGRLGAAALSAVALGGQFAWTILFVVGSLGTGTMILVSRRVGEGNHEEALRTGGTAIFLMFTVAAAISLAVYALVPGFFRLAGTEPEVSSLGIEYVRIMALSSAFVLPSMAGTAILRGWGDTRTPLLIIGVANASNIVFDYVLIFGHLGLPAMGVRGAAIASFIAHFLGFAIVMWYLFYRWKKPGLRFSHLRRLHLSTMGRLVRLSLPTAMEWFVIDSSRTVQSLIVASLGTTALAAHQVAAVAESLSLMPGWGITVATTILVGQNMGAGQRDAAHESARQGTIVAVLAMGSFGLAFLAFPQAIASVFTSDLAVIAVAASCIMVAAAAQPFVALGETLAGSLRGAGDTRSPFYAAAFTSWGVRIPLTLLFVKVLGLPLPYVWLALFLDWSLRSGIMAILFRRGHWKEIKI